MAAGHMLTVSTQRHSGTCTGSAFCRPRRVKVWGAEAPLIKDEKTTSAKSTTAAAKQSA